MDDNQCRVCLGEADDTRYSVFKKINGVAIEEKLKFVCGLQITKNDSFSKLLCKKCFNETCIAFNLKTKCLDTDRTLKALERKLNEKLSNLESFRQQNVQQQFKEPLEAPKEEYIEVFAEDVKQEEIVEFVDDGDSESNEIIADESLKAEEDIEYLEEYFIEDDGETEQTDYQHYLENDLDEHQLKVEIVREPKLSAINSKRSCIYCNPSRTFKTDIGLKLHKFEVHQIGDENPLVCSTCNFTFNGELKEEQLSRLIQKHASAHERGKSHACMFCPEVFKSSRHFEEHQIRHINSSLSHNQCKGCQSIFTSVEELQTHLWSSSCKETHERPFKCYICQESFTMGIAKKKHIQVEHQDKAGADCPLCLRCKIPSAVAYENHYKTHFAEPRFCCNYCARPFYESDRLQTHIKRAHETQKFECNWCGKTFRDKSGIARHILGVHFNQRNHRCHLCSKAFTEAYNLKEHMFSVHKQATKFYNCELCNQNFLYRKQFERHRNSCTGFPEKRRR